MPDSKEYNPHIVAVWTSPDNFAVVVQEFPYKEDAETKYEEIVQRGVSKIILAKVIKVHGE